MFEDNREDILLNSKAIDLLSSSRVLIVGGGRAGYIKLASFASRGFSVDVLSEEFAEGIRSISLENPKVRLLSSIYSRDMLQEYELVVVGTSDQRLNSRIAEDCRSLGKLYIYLSDYREGRASVMAEFETENIKLAVSTRCGSPKTSVFLGQKLKSLIEEYDDFVEYVGSLRSRIKDSERKREIMAFVNTEEFYELYRAGKGDSTIQTLYGGDLIDNSTCD